MVFDWMTKVKTITVTVWFYSDNEANEDESFLSSCLLVSNGYANTLNMPIMVF